MPGHRRLPRKQYTTRIFRLSGRLAAKACLLYFTARAAHCDKTAMKRWDCRFHRPDGARYERNAAKFAAAWVAQPCVSRSRRSMGTMLERRAAGATSAGGLRNCESNCKFSHSAGRPVR